MPKHQDCKLRKLQKKILTQRDSRCVREKIQMAYERVDRCGGLVSKTQKLFLISKNTQMCKKTKTCNLLIPKTIYFTYVLIYSFENIEAFDLKNIRCAIKKSKTWKRLTSKIEYEDFQFRFLFCFVKNFSLRGKHANQPYPKQCYVSRIAMYLFPAIFFVFNLLYWTYYLIVVNIFDLSLF